MIVLALLALWCAFAAPAAAQTPEPRPGGLRVTVRDATPLPIAGASVTVTSAAGPTLEASTNDRGIAEFDTLPPGRYNVVIESSGFEPAAIANVAVRTGARVSRDVQLAVAGILERVDVLPADMDRQLTDAFTTVLTEDDIAVLPDDPEELALALERFAGPDADIRIDGFANSELPPGAQIQSVRIRYDGGSAGSSSGGPRVEIRTHPGGDRWRSTASFGIRDEALSARNALSPERPQGQTRNYSWSVAGPVVKNKTGLSFTIDRGSSIGQEAIRAATPDGLFAALIPLPRQRLSVSGSLDHAVTQSQQLRFDFRHSADRASNLGLGELDLPERSFARENADGHLRFGHNATLRGSMVHDLRLQLRWRSNDTTPASAQTATRVLGAFTTGGAQTQGGRRVRELELEDELMFVIRTRHQVTTGVNVVGVHLAGDEWRNAGGTFTFASLDDFVLGRPTTFTQRVGDPTFAYSLYRFGAFIQEDFRIRRNLLLQAGVRHESQTRLSDWANFVPRLGINWTPSARLRTSLRVNYNVSLQAYQGSTYEQTLLVDGKRQRDVVVTAPVYPDAFAGGIEPATVPPAIIRASPDLMMPSTRRVSVAVDQPLGANLRLRANYSRHTGRHQFRSIDANAPVNGIRPDESVLTIAELRSSARSFNESLAVNASINVPRRRLSVNAGYVLGEQRNEADGPLTLPPDSFNLSQEWGPSRQDVRHRFDASINTSLWFGFRLYASGRAQSASPYTVTTGLDVNGDGVNNERPEGVGRNSRRGAGSKVLDLTLTWELNVGRRATPPARARPGGAQERPSPRLQFELFATANNVLNAANLQAFNGVATSQFFGQPTSASAPRRFALGARLSL